METKYGFIKMDISEFESWIANFRVGRTIIYLQQHHTVAPSYQHFDDTNHFQLQKNMKDYHVGSNGWMDIGQHFSIFPDGSIVTGRSLELTPACIYGNNSGAICIENVGFFDTGEDTMNQTQADAIVRATAAICKKFNIPINTDKIVYHHWFHLSSGSRNNGSSGNKTCPGTAFFGGNKVEDCETDFLPLVRNVMIGGTVPQAPVLLKYVSVTASALNVRVLPTSSSLKASDRTAMVLGSVLRVYEEQDNWFRISSSQQHWVSARYTDDVERAEVNAVVLNVRSGPSTSFAKVGSFLKNQEVFVYERSNGWCRVSLDNKWVKDDYLDF
ncbi:SH3 domain-containing protein [Arcticibacterium luteifluviistationis]|uniref:N-acetylmuramoyl-L-alanine amidase n=1 Tax=Arcticibacterium luteifluviistationis TaxID=1784714 RepID=A0A2Z4G8K6_9BACT|nr:SH3 domain-containing protein [Arcticibacterium luteifluviistationis]AWV97484.1 N-acetylmuramoyl-L-alanine amidase [Arcticibacterium luteifluviistationis]